MRLWWKIWEIEPTINHHTDTWDKWQLSCYQKNGYTCYRDMEYDATTGMYVFVKQTMWYPCSKLRIYKPYMAILCCFEKGNDSHKSNFEVHPLFRHTCPCGFHGYVPLQFLVSNFSIFSGYFHLGNIQQIVPVVFPSATTLQVLRLSWYRSSLLPWWPESSSIQGLLKPKQKARKPNIVGIGIWDMGCMRLTWECIWFSFFGGGPLCIYDFLS